MARIGFVQTQGVGDILMGLPIAAAFARGGNEVSWPVDQRFAEFLAAAAPYVEFLPVRGKPDSLDYFYAGPQKLLAERRCDEIFVLYSQLNIPALGKQASLVKNPKLAQYLKIDEYKYAVTGVPFSEKWNLDLRRDRVREERLFESLEIRGDFICVHRRGSIFEGDLTLPPEWRERYRIIEVDERTSSPFDWITTFERASKLVCLDSLFANLVDQLGLPNEKYLLLRSPGLLTPVFRSGWQFL
jgi:hypothetical protein